jgi:hypothetical protein
VITNNAESDCNALLQTKMLAYIARYGDLPLAGDGCLHGNVSKSITP